MLATEVVVKALVHLALVAVALSLAPPFVGSSPLLGGRRSNVLLTVGEGFVASSICDSSLLGLNLGLERVRAAALAKDALVDDKRELGALQER